MQTWYFARDMKSRINREVYVRFCEGLRGKFPRSTRPDNFRFRNLLLLLSLDPALNCIQGNLDGLFYLLGVLGKNTQCA